jgi:hypothetical protein
MDWAQIFTFANGYAIIWWLVLALAPRGPKFMNGVFFGGVSLLAAAYSALIIGLLSGSIDGGGTGAAPDFTTLAGVQALFASDGGATIGWIHYLAFDLFVGLWAARNADAHGIHRAVQAPILFFILMAGPLGLILYLIVRAALAKDGALSLPH